MAPADRELVTSPSWTVTFNDLRCSLGSRSGSSADVHCNFADITDPNAGMSNVSFWNFTLHREPSGRWLITSYGQG